jgi:hypothetical protein
LFDPLYEEGDKMWMKPDSKSGFQSIQMKRIINKEAGWLNSIYG